MTKAELVKEAQKNCVCTNAYMRINYVTGYIAGAEPREKRIEALEQENAELKEQLKSYNGCGDWDNDFHTCRVYLQHEELQMYADQLTKAKELLGDWLQIAHKNHARCYGFVKDTEQFLEKVK